MDGKIIKKMVGKKSLCGPAVHTIAVCLPQRGSRLARNVPCQDNHNNNQRDACPSVEPLPTLPPPAVVGHAAHTLAIDAHAARIVPSAEVRPKKL